ncbi:MAG TPA: invasion associated locus B family protein, partial [Microvirga sp.]|nr:invasion associated locus B family protein [Microvirga sp.]
MGRWARLAAALSFGVAGGVLALSPGDRAEAQGVVKNTFGDWQMRCETPAGAQAEQCAIVQNVAAEDRPNVSLVIIVLRTADRKSHLLRVIAP